MEGNLTSPSSASPSPAPPGRGSSSKRGLIVTLIALVVVIVVASVAYNAFAGSGPAGKGGSPTSASPHLEGDASASSASAAASTSASAPSAATSAGATSTSASAGSASSPTGETSASSSASATDYPQLADYNPTVYTASGEPTTFVDIAGGKLLVVNFWATWCPYCVDEFPDFQKIYDDYADRVSFAFVDIADGRRETVEIAARWVAEGGYTMPLYYDTTMEAQYVYGASSLPTTVITDADGNIVSFTPGRINADRLRSTLDGLLAG